jgi:hypothetical protein
MLEGIKANDVKPVVKFINYTQNLIQKAPALNYYIELVNAYHIIGETELRDKLLQEAIDTYEGNSRLKRMELKFQPKRK